MKRNAIALLAGALLMLFSLMAMGQTKIVETGAGNFMAFDCISGGVVTVSDSIWAGTEDSIGDLSACIVENISPSTTAEVGLYLKGGFQTFPLSGGKSLALPCDFQQMRRIFEAEDGESPDSLAVCISGTVRFYFAGD